MERPRTPATEPPGPGPRAAPTQRAIAAVPAEWRSALASAWRALWWSRLVVWAGGLVGLAAIGRSGRWRDFDPGSVTAPFGGAADWLVAPAARWDAVWYLAIANDGYRDSGRAAFFPLYPLLVAALQPLTRSPVVAGIALSLAALLVALTILHRLAVLEIGADAAGTAVVLLAIFPAAYCFSAVYSESLFLALSVGAIYAARVDRWAWAGVLGMLAAGSRSAGVVLVVPLALLYLYGPRGPAGTRPRARSWRPRFPVRANALWIGLVPLGLGAFVGYLALAGADPAAPFTAQAEWMRVFAGPFVGVWEGAVAAFDGARQLLSGSRAPVYFTVAAGDPFVIAAQNLILFAFMVLGLVGTVGALRRLPVAYGGYMVAAIALPLSYPVAPQPLMSFPRFLAVLFPLHLWLALVVRRRGWRRPVVAASAVMLAIASAQFAAWEWVA
ncbi:MAG TPA: mannosyltransferase family protein [Solirubrobacteraceae bacterium]|nr:mannosyltransferase family protein [Solirubrobacteraceae bacterium]